MHLRRRQKQATVSRAPRSRIIAVNPVKMAAKSFPASVSGVGNDVTIRAVAVVERSGPLSPTNDDSLDSLSSGGSTVQQQLVSK